MIPPLGPARFFSDVVLHEGDKFVVAEEYEAFAQNPRAPLHVFEVFTYGFIAARTPEGMVIFKSRYQRMNPRIQIVSDRVNTPEAQPHV